VTDATPCREIESIVGKTPGVTCGNHSLLFPNTKRGVRKRVAEDHSVENRIRDKAPWGEMGEENVVKRSKHGFSETQLGPRPASGSETCCHGLGLGMGRGRAWRVGKLRPNGAFLRGIEKDQEEVGPSSGAMFPVGRAQAIEVKILDQSFLESDSGPGGREGK